MSAEPIESRLELSLDDARHSNRASRRAEFLAEIHRDESTDGHVAVLERLQFSVSGLASKREAARLQRRLAGLDGVLEARVRFEEGTAVVSVLDQRVDAATLIWTIEAEGGAAALVRSADESAGDAGADEHVQLRRRALTVGLPALVVVLASLLTRDLNIGGPFVRRLTTDGEIFVAALVFWFGRDVFVRGATLASWRTAAREAPIALAAGAAAAYGLWAFFSHQEPRFDVPVVLVAGYHIGLWLESALSLRAQTALADLRAVWPTEATVRRAERHFCVPLDTLQPDDLIVVGRGDTVPVDGIILETLSEHVLLEESLVLGDGARRQKGQGDRVLAGTLLEDGAAVVRPERWGRDSVLGRMLGAVGRAARTRAPSQARGDRFAALLTPVALLAAIATFVVWRETVPDGPFWTALSPALAVLVVMSPWALGWASAMPVLSAMTRGVRRGVLFRDAEALERTRDLQVVMVEKSGTLTVGRPEVETLELLGAAEASTVARWLRAVEQKSEHAIAEAVRTYAEELDTETAELPPVLSFRQIPGCGVMGRVEGEEVVFGTVNLLDGKGIAVPEGQRGAEWLYLAVDGALKARLRIFDPIREDGAAMVQRLGAAGIRPMLLTSSTRAEAERVAAQVHLDPGDVRAEIDGDSHAQAVRAVQAAGRCVGVVGRVGEDDAALGAADIAFALCEAGGRGDRDAQLPDDGFAVVAVRPGEGGVGAALDIAESAFGRVRENLVASSLLMVVGFMAAVGWLGPAGAMGVVLGGVLGVGANGLR